MRVAPHPRLLPPPGVTLERATPQVVVTDLDFQAQCRHVKLRRSKNRLSG
jgi:hypothetical protein